MNAPAVASKVPFGKTPRCVRSQIWKEAHAYSCNICSISQLISSIEVAIGIKAGSHELGYVAILRDRLTKHRPLRHRGIVFVALKRARVVFDLSTDKDQRDDEANRGNDLSEIGQLLERHTPNEN
jgi:hypothetical protein